MAEQSVVKAVRDYLYALRQAGMQVDRAILYGSHARGDAHPDSDVDILVIATEFDGPYDPTRVALLWEMRACTDSRIEPIGIGERRWREDSASPIIEIARREGQEIGLEHTLQDVMAEHVTALAR